MCPCPICLTIAVLLAPFFCFRWAKNKIKKHHINCETCQQAEHRHCQKEHIKCTCERCQHKKKGKRK